MLFIVNIRKNGAVEISRFNPPEFFNLLTKWNENFKFRSLCQELPCLPNLQWLNMLIGFRGLEEQFEYACSNGIIAPGRAKSLYMLYNKIWHAYGSALEANSPFIDKIDSSVDNINQDFGVRSCIDWNLRYFNIDQLIQGISQFEITQEEKSAGLDSLWKSVALMTTLACNSCFEDNPYLIDNYLVDDRVELIAGMNFMLDQRIDTLEEFYQQFGKYFSKDLRKSFKNVVAALEATNETKRVGQKFIFNVYPIIYVTVLCEQKFNYLARTWFLLHCRRNVLTTTEETQWLLNHFFEKLCIR